MKNVMIISVHPDDETLGCGGTILKHLSNGDCVSIVFITGGNSLQKKLINNVCLAYNVNKHYELDLPEIYLENMPLVDIISPLNDVILDFKPEVLYVPNRSDVHSDHRAVFQAAQACIKSFRNPFIKKVLMMEIISETDFSPPLLENIFIPNVIIDISDFYEKKESILLFFKHELLDGYQTRTPSAMKSLNRYRGSLINTKYAESFMLIKEIL
jgi:N-acetylglucosamine malate deacetylase 1